MSNSEQRSVMVRLEMEDLADDSNIERYIDHLESRLEDLKVKNARLHKVKFPVALRKMWSGREVQDWIDSVLSEDSNHE